MKYIRELIRLLLSLFRRKKYHKYRNDTIIEFTVGVPFTPQPASQINLTFGKQQPKGA